MSNWHEDSPLWPFWNYTTEQLAALRKYADTKKKLKRSKKYRSDGSFNVEYAAWIYEFIRKGKQLGLPRYKVRDVFCTRFWDFNSPEMFLKLLGQFYKCGCKEPCNCSIPDLNTTLKNLSETL